MIDCVVFSASSVIIRTDLCSQSVRRSGWPKQSEKQNPGQKSAAIGDVGISEVQTTVSRRFGDLIRESEKREGTKTVLVLCGDPGTLTQEKRPRLPHGLCWKCVNSSSSGSLQTQCSYKTRLWLHGDVITHSNPPQSERSGLIRGNLVGLLAWWNINIILGEFNVMLWSWSPAVWCILQLKHIGVGTKGR